MTGHIWLSRNSDYESREEDLERDNLFWISEKVAWNSHRQLRDVRLRNHATFSVFGIVGLNRTYQQSRHCELADWSLLLRLDMEKCGPCAHLPPFYLVPLPIVAPLRGHGRVSPFSEKVLSWEAWQEILDDV